MIPAASWALRPTRLPDRVSGSVSLPAARPYASGQFIWKCRRSSWHNPVKATSLIRAVEDRRTQASVVHPLATAVLAIVALGGVMLPAWRAASLNPTDALRLE